MGTIKKIFCFVFTIFLLFSCKKKKDDPAGSTGPTLIARVNNIARIQRSVQSAGQNSGTSLTSFKYFVLSIAICQNLTITGSGFSNPSGCITLYQSPNENWSIEEFMEAKASQNDSYYTDFMDVSTLNNLIQSKTLNSGNVGSYQYGYIRWYMPVKYTASFALNNGSTVYTKDGTLYSFLETNSNTTFYYNNVTGMATAPAAETISILNNIGSAMWFRFSEPFTITQQDIDNGTTLNLALNFNPDNAIKAFKVANNCNTGGGMSSYNIGAEVCNTDAGNYTILDIHPPSFLPVPYKNNENVVKETYLLHYNSAGGNKWDIRVDLYYSNASANAIYSGELRTVVTSQTIGYVEQIYKVYSVAIETDSTITLGYYNGKSIIRNITREQNGTAKYRCRYGDSDNCSDENTEVDVSYTYVGKENVAGPGVNYQ